MPDDNSAFDAEVFRRIENIRRKLLGIVPLESPMPEFLRRQLFLPVTQTKEKQNGG